VALFTALVTFAVIPWGPGWVIFRHANDRLEAGERSTLSSIEEQLARGE